MAVNWKVVPICDFQKLDVRPEDLLNDGDFRKCNTYRGGGGYDQFPFICERRLGRKASQQFVVQLYGCNLDCPYCYVTRTGIWNPWKPYTSSELAEAFRQSSQEVFHLMGGAPAIYLDQWPDLLDHLSEDVIFHSDFLLSEKTYDPVVLSQVARPNCLFAVDIKGVTPDDWLRNTRKSLNEKLLWANLENLVDASVPFYLTFTNPDRNHYPRFVERLVDGFGPRIMDDAFTIDLIDYDALPYVDILPATRLRKELEGGTK